MDAPGRGTLDVGGVTLVWRDTPWDARALGVPTVELLAVHRAGDEALPAALAALDDHLAAAGCGLVTTRVPAADAPLVAALAAAGFAPVETSHALTLDLAARDPLATFRRTVAVEPALASDRDALVALARDGFDYSRFHEDARIHPARARDRYARWIADSLDAHLAGTGDRVWIHRHRGALAAVMTFRPITLGACTLLLGGTAAGANLVAPMFWTGVLAGLRAEGAARIDTRVSAANAAALRLHLALGFTIASTDTGLTKLYPGGAAVVAAPP